MKFTRKAAIAVNLNQPLPEVFRSLRELDVLSRGEVHLVYSFYTISYLVGMGDTALVYPLEEDRKKIEESILATLEQYKRKLFPDDFPGKVIVRCLFSDDAKRRFCQYVEDEGIDLVIAAARKKKGFFESSFTQYVNKHTDANLLILKEN